MRDPYSPDAEGRVEIQYVLFERAGTDIDQRNKTYYLPVPGTIGPYRKIDADLIVLRLG